MTNYLSQFTFVGNSIYINKAANTSVMLNEDYKRTWRAYRWGRPNWRFVVTNKNGNAIRFRSAEAAAKHLVLKVNTGDCNEN